MGWSLGRRLDEKIAVRQKERDKLNLEIKTALAQELGRANTTLDHLRAAVLFYRGMLKSAERSAPGAEAKAQWTVILETGKRLAEGDASMAEVEKALALQKGTIDGLYQLEMGKRRRN